MTDLEKRTEFRESNFLKFGPRVCLGVTLFCGALTLGSCLAKGEERPPVKVADEDLRRHEGIRNRVYTDTEGNKTIGIGFNLNRAGARKVVESAGLEFDELYSGRATLTNEQIEKFYRGDLQTAITSARRYLGKEWYSQPAEVQAILINMAYQMPYGMNKWPGLKQDILSGNYEAASKEMQFRNGESGKKTPWYNQSGNRSKELVRRMKKLQK